MNNNNKRHPNVGDVRVYPERSLPERVTVTMSGRFAAWLVGLFAAMPADGEWYKLFESMSDFVPQQRDVSDWVDDALDATGGMDKLPRPGGDLDWGRVDRRNSARW